MTDEEWEKVDEDIKEKVRKQLEECLDPEWECPCPYCVSGGPRIVIPSEEIN